jgi:multidrug efflux pump subunit AcrB
VVGYIASGGPRFYLSLAPVDGYPKNGYLIVNVKRTEDVVTVRERLKAWAVVAIPEARVTPKVMSMGLSESGLVEFRVIGQDSAVLSRASEALMAALRAAPDTIGIKSDWENPTSRCRSSWTRMLRAELGFLRKTLRMRLTRSSLVTNFRVDDVTIPVVPRAQGEQRTNLDRVRTLNVGVVGGSAVPLLQVAKCDAICPIRASSGVTCVE